MVLDTIVSRPLYSIQIQTPRAAQIDYILERSVLPCRVKGKPRLTSFTVSEAVKIINVSSTSMNVAYRYCSNDCHRKMNKK